MHLLNTSPDRIRAAEIQRLQMEANQLAAWAAQHGLALDMKVEPGQPATITVREARNGS